MHITQCSRGMRETFPAPWAGLELQLSLPGPTTQDLNLIPIQLNFD